MRDVSPVRHYFACHFNSRNSLASYLVLPEEGNAKDQTGIQTLAPWSALPTELSERDIPPSLMALSRFFFPSQDFHLQVQRWSTTPNVTGREKFNGPGQSADSGTLHLVRWNRPKWSEWDRTVIRTRSPLNLYSL